jgi:hypothetical protein
MPKPFRTMRMSTKSELLYGALFFLIALIARSVSLSMSPSFLRDVISVLGVVMLAGSAVVAVVGLWHAASRADDPKRTVGFSVPGWFPDQGDPTLLRFWDGSAWTGETARRETLEIRS